MRVFPGQKCQISEEEFAQQNVNIFVLTFLSFTLYNSVYTIELNVNFVNFKTLVLGRAACSLIKSNMYQHVRMRQNYDLKMKALKSLFFLLQF